MTKSGKYVILSLLAVVLFSLVRPVESGAVLRERNLGRTLDVLCAELENTYKQMKVMMEMYDKRARTQHESLVATMQRIDQVSLMLYSQRSEFTFDMAYACQQATDLYRSNHLMHMPYDRINKMLTGEIERYDSIIVVLQHIAPAIDGSNELEAQDRADSLLVVAQKSQKAELFKLDEQQQETRQRCITYATVIRNDISSLIEKMDRDREHYSVVTQKLKNLNSFALRKYEELKSGIFENAGRNYLQVLMSSPRQMRQLRRDAVGKYSTLHYGDAKRTPIRSDWRGPVIVGTSIFILLYIAIATVLSAVIMRWLVPKRIRNTEGYRHKRSVIGLACGVLLFTIAITVARSYMYNNFIYMAIGITIDYAWLLLAILVSLIIRLSNKQLKSGVKSYMPFMLMAFVVIVFRIVFIPNNVVNLIFPPIMLLFTIWQMRVIRKRTEKLPVTDVIFSGISLLAMVISCVLAFIGYTLLAVQVMVWWSFQLAFIQSIICFYDIARMYMNRYVINRVRRAAAKQLAEKKPKKGKKVKSGSAVEELMKRELTEADKAKLLAQAAKGDFINITWLYDFVVKTVLPVLAVLSIILSIGLAAKLFDMQALLGKYFFYNFINKAGLLSVSLYKLVLVGALFFVFYYVNYMLHSVYRRLKKRTLKAGANANITLANNIISILVWGIYFIFALVLFQVPKSGISLISAGLATGLGFAMKDILENFIYGLSLMSGRVRVGDYIECDGILGKVESIGYQSTQIITMDGSIIAFLNTSLFNKNFKNMTRNHSYEFVKIPVGVAYGVKVEEVRRALVDGLSHFGSAMSKSGKPLLQKKQGFRVAFGDFDDSAVTLIVAFWVLVEEKIAFVCQVKEEIYKILQERNIEIPFPQRDVYIRQMPQLASEQNVSNNKTE